MAAQGSAEPTGRAKITRAYNLPCDYVLHTVGPIVERARHVGGPSACWPSCYRSCLELAAQHGVQSVAFCCISTGVFHFPNERAAEIAVETVRRYKSETESNVKGDFQCFQGYGPGNLRAAPRRRLTACARRSPVRMPWSSARARGSPLPQDLFIPASGLKNIFQISPQNTVFTICTPVGFTRMQRLKNTGPIGAVLFTSTVI